MSAEVFEFRINQLIGVDVKRNGIGFDKDFIVNRIIFRSEFAVFQNAMFHRRTGMSKNQIGFAFRKFFRNLVPRLFIGVNESRIESQVVERKTAQSAKRKDNPVVCRPGIQIGNLVECVENLRSRLIEVARRRVELNNSYFCHGYNKCCYS